MSTTHIQEVWTCNSPSYPSTEQKGNSSSSREPPSPLSSDKEKPEERRTPEVTQEGLVVKEEVPEGSIIYIDDDLEPSSLAKMEVQIDKLKMPPPVVIH